MQFTGGVDLVKKLSCGGYEGAAVGGRMMHRMAEGGGDGGDAVTKTADWVQRLVVGKSLCPFAAEPLRKGEIKTVTWEGGEGRGEPLEVVKNEIESLLNEATKEKTTLVVFTDGCRFSKFEVLISFSYEVLEVINEAGLGDEVQVSATVGEDGGGVLVVRSRIVAHPFPADCNVPPRR